jgi:hypothetical protein
MNTREIASEHRLSHWAQIMQERQARGVSIKEYCRQIGIGANTYFYWQKKLRESAAESLLCQGTKGSQCGLAKAGFAEVKLSDNRMPAAGAAGNQTGTLRIEVPGMSIAADGSYPTEKLAELLRKLVRPC